MTIEHKTVGAVIKQAGDDGSFEAVIATFGELDKDGDIVMPGAFGDQPVSVLPSHDSQHVPLGKTRVEERGSLAVAAGMFNLEVSAAREWHSAIKFDLAHEPAVQEWSWGFTPVEVSFEERDGEQIRILEKVDLREVSPVLRGASVGTGTLSAKGEGCVRCRHEHGHPATLEDDIKLVTGDVEAIVQRIQEVAEGRKERDRKLGKGVRLATVEMAQQCSKLMDELAAVIDSEVLPEDEAAKAAARWAASEALRRGVEV